jgi:hypothetical protein
MWNPRIFALSRENSYKFTNSRCEGAMSVELTLVSCPINSVAFVAIKMGRRSGNCL